ncbi:MAG: hypothetical protein FJX77_04085, partial [Armatimonadetes bacterium]|nr:hypothetical protein [Armatimonadota bacterium]
MLIQRKFGRAGACPPAEPATRTRLSSQIPVISHRFAGTRDTPSPYFAHPAVRPRPAGRPVRLGVILGQPGPVRRAWHLSEPDLSSGGTFKLTQGEVSCKGNLFSVQRPVGLTPSAPGTKDVTMLQRNYSPVRSAPRPRPRCSLRSGPTFARLLGGVLLLAAGVAAAEPVWDQFRGPRAQGHTSARGLPVEWSQTRNVLWRTPLPGQAWSSPILAEGKVFLTNAVPLTEADPARGVSLRVLALEARSGALLWDKEVLQQRDPEALHKHGKNSQASPTPIYEAGRIYAHFGHHGTACMDTAGNLVWRTQDHRYPPRHGTGGSPVLTGDLLIFNADG